MCPNWLNSSLKIPTIIIMENSGKYLYCSLWDFSQHKGYCKNLQKIFKIFILIKKPLSPWRLPSRVIDMSAKTTKEHSSLTRGCGMHLCSIYQEPEQKMRKKHIHTMKVTAHWAQVPTNHTIDKLQSISLMFCFCFSLTTLFKQFYLLVIFRGK